MFPTIDAYLAAEVSYRREQLTRSWSAEPVLRRGRRTAKPRTPRRHHSGHPSGRAALVR
jgi:hypothetical protein